VADINRRVTDVRLSITALDEYVDVLARELGAYATTATESNAYVGAEMRRLQDAVESHEARITERLETLEGLGYVERLNRAVDAPLEHLDGAVANLINHAAGHRGFAAEAGLWFNPAVTVELGEGKAHLAGVNERIVELPFALGALSRVSPPARVLDIGGAESTFSLSAASLGYQVTAVDLHPLPYSHPDLEAVVGRFEDWDPGTRRFSAAFLISTIEHFGLGAYGEAPGQKGADRAAVERVSELLDDEGFLVLTTPYGPTRVDDLERVYDEKALAALLKGWTVIDHRTVLRKDERTWLPEVPGGASPTDKEQGVVMVVAVPARPA
jgi:hypothetical protein